MVGKEQETIREVTIIVDANIVFSGILNTKGKIADLLINSQGLISFIAPDYLRIELRKYHTKLSKLSKLSLEEVREAEFQICKDITFISEGQISKKSWNAAFELVKDVDPKDVLYVAYAIEFNSNVWSGDRSLMRGLQKKSFDKILSTDALHVLREKGKKK